MHAYIHNHRRNPKYTYICICVVMEPFILKFLAVYVGAGEEEQIALKLLNFPLTKIISATK